jgi:hypothetical protein
MALLPLTLPPGVYRNGTDFQAAGRWLDSHLVRWIDNTIRPIGGWSTFSTDDAAAPLRGSLSWKDNSNNLYLAAGSADNLYTYTVDGDLVDITPTGLAAGREDGSANLAYGGGYYGLDYYGTERIDGAGILPATTWALDNWGEYLVACADTDGKIYEWQLDRSTPTVAAVLANAPTNNRSIIVTEERFLFALGADGNSRKVQWCDREDTATWTPDATNEAGDYELQTVGYIECGIKVRGQTLIITDQDAHSATYIGAPYVYGFQRVGNACGIISKKAGTAVEGNAFWMGEQNFYMYDGSIVRELSCEVDDYVFRNINRDQKSKICAVSNRRFNEIWWFYPTGDSLENNAYVIYNYRENTWYIGNLGRSTGVDAGVYRYPVFFCVNNYRPHQHELGFDYHSADAPYAETGAISLGAGDNVMHVTKLIPDELTQGDVTATFKTRFHPNDTERTYGAYTMSNPTSIRFTGRQVKMRIDGARLTSWRLGTMRLDVSPGGKR